MKLRAPFFCVLLCVCERLLARDHTRRKYNCELEADVAFVVDTSSSVGDADFTRMLDFITGFLIGHINKDGNQHVRVAMLSFSSNVTINFFLNTYQSLDEIVDAIWNIPRHSGSTNTADAIRRMSHDIFTRERGDRPYVQNMAVVITDGVSNLNAERTVTEALRGKAAGIAIFSLGIGLTGRTPELQLICTPPHKDNLIVVDNFKELNDVRRDLAAKMCKVAAEYVPMNVSVEPTPTPTEPYCNYPYDVIFVIDSESAIGSVNFAQAQQYITHYASELDPQLASLYLVVHDESSTEVLPFFDVDQDSAMSASLMLPENGLGVIHKKLLKTRYGNRENIQDFVVILTNGDNNIQAIGQMSRKVKDRKAYVLTVGVGPAIRQRSIRRFSSDPNDINTLFASEWSRLQTIHGTLRLIVCNVARRELLLVTQGEGGDTDEPGENGGSQSNNSNNTTNILGNHNNNTNNGNSNNINTVINNNIGQRDEEIGETINDDDNNDVYEGILESVKETLPKTDCRGKGDIILVLDSSGSVTIADFYRALGFIKLFAEYLLQNNDKIRLALATFSDDAFIHVRLEEHLNINEFKQKCDEVSYVYGSTNMARALSAIRKDILRNVTKNSAKDTLVLMITDGLSNSQTRETIPEAIELQALGVFISAIAVYYKNIRDLESMVSRPYEDFLYHVDSYSTIATVLPSLVPLLCSGVDPCISNPCVNSDSCMSMLGKLVCQCEYGFTGSMCHLNCSIPTDIVFLVESAARVGEQNFDMVVDFIRSIGQEISVESCPYRFGLLKYGSNAILQFHLNEANSQPALLQMLDTVAYSHGYTNTQQALKFARQHMFQTSHGDRSHARNYLVLFTNGISNKRTDVYTEVQVSRGRDITVVPFGIEHTNRDYLDHMASNPSASFLAYTYTALPDHLYSFVNFLLKDDDMCSTDTCLNGGSCITQASQQRCICPIQWHGLRCQTQCTPSVEIIVAVDSTGYMSLKKFALARNIFSLIVEALVMLSGNIRLGIVSLNRNVQTIKRLTSNLDAFTLMDSFNNIRLMQHTDMYLLYHEKIYSSFSNQVYNGGNKMLLVFITPEQMININLYNTAELGINTIVLTVAEEGSVDFHYQPRTPYTVPLYVEQGQRLDVNDASRKALSFLCEDINQCWHFPCLNGGVCEDGTHSYFCKCMPGYGGEDCNKSCREKTDILFILDSSGSVGRYDFVHMKSFANQIVRQLNVGLNHMQIAVLTFSSYPRIALYLNTFDTKDDIIKAINSIQYVYGDSNIADSLTFAREVVFQEENGDRPDAMNIVILLVDGVGNVNPRMTNHEADLLKRKQVFILGIGIGRFDTTELTQIVTGGVENNPITVSSYTELQEQYHQAISMICIGSKDVCQSNPCQNGGICKQMMQSFTCKCEQGYTGKLCQIGCYTATDLALLVDSSSSLGRNNFEMVLEFVSNVTLLLPRHIFRTALVTYSETSKVWYLLNSNMDQDEITAAIYRTIYIEGATNIASALEAAKTQVFVETNGDRPFAKNKILLIADGLSNIEQQHTLSAAQTLHIDNVHIHAIGVQLRDVRELNSIANVKPILVIDSFRDLDSRKDAIVDLLCNT